MDSIFLNRIKNKYVIFQLTLVAALVSFSSCSGTDYLNAIPEESSALVSMDISNMSGVNSKAILKTMLHASDISDCGLDLASKIYLFESPDGNLGLCAKVNDDGDLNNMFNKLAGQGVCQKTKERRGFHFTVLNDTWVVGFSDNAMLVLGPVAVSAQAELQNLMAKYLKQKEDDGIKGTPIYDKLDSIRSPMAIVIQAQALPEKFVAPFTLGAPKDADASQVLIAAEMNVKDGCLNIDGETFSYNRNIDKSLKDAAKIYRPIKGKYTKSMASDALMGMFMNVDGKQFLTLLQNNKRLLTLMSGINAAIDMDNIIRSVDGDMAIVMPNYTDDNIQMSMSAELSNNKWLDDVGYWKQSCPKGGRIEDWNKNSYYYTDGKTSFYFGVSDDKQFYSGNSDKQALSSIQSAENPIAVSLQNHIMGKKMVMVINLHSIKNDKIGAIAGFMTPIFGKLNSIVYTLK